MRSPTPQTPFAAHLLIHRQGAGIRVQADTFHAEAGEIGAPPGGHQQVLPGQLLATVQREPEGVPGMAHTGGPGSGAYCDPLPAQYVGEQLAGLGLLRGQQPLHRLDDGHHRAESGECLGQFDTDGTAAEHDQRSGRLLGRDRLAVGPVRHLVQARHRGNLRAAAGRQHHALPGREHLAVDVDPAGAG